MNTRAAGRGTTTAGIAATTDAVTTVAAAGARGRQGTTRSVDSRKRKEKVRARAARRSMAGQLC